MKIKTLPNVLALHLKRFKYQEDLGRYIKLSYRVVFPFHLRLPNTSEQTDNPDRLYELFAFVVHIGGCVRPPLGSTVSKLTSLPFTQRPAPRPLHRHRQDERRVDDV